MTHSVLTSIRRFFRYGVALGAILPSVLIAAPVYPPLYSDVSVGVGNSYRMPNGSTVLFIHHLASAHSLDGQLVDTGHTARDFTALNTSGAIQTESFSGRATAQAGFGSLHLMTSYSLVNGFGNGAAAPYVTGPDLSLPVNPDGLPTGFLASAQVGMYDRLTVDASPAVSYVELTFRLTGTISETGGPLTQGYQNELYVQGSVGYHSFFRGSFDEMLVARLPVIGGSAELGLQMWASSGLRSIWDSRRSPDTSGVVDFSHSLSLQSVSAYDEQGTRLELISLRGAYGYDYVSMTMVPEPPVWVLLMAGLGWVRWRQSSRVRGLDTPDAKESRT